MARLPVTPRQFVRYAGPARNKVPAALLIFGLAIGLTAAKRGRMPSSRQTAGYAIAAVIIAMATSVAPDLVVYFLLALLFVLALDATPTIQRLSGQLTGLLQPTPVAGGKPSPGLFQ